MACGPIDCFKWIFGAFAVGVVGGGIAYVLWGRRALPPARPPKALPPAKRSRVKFRR